MRGRLSCREGRLRGGREGRGRGKGSDRSIFGWRGGCVGGGGCSCCKGGSSLCRGRGAAEGMLIVVKVISRVK